MCFPTPFVPKIIFVTFLGTAEPILYYTTCTKSKQI